MVYVFIIAGGILGAAVLEAGGIIPGMLLGYLFFRVRKSSEEIKKLTAKLILLERQLRGGAEPDVEKPTETVLGKEQMPEAPPLARPEPAKTAMPADQPVKEMVEEQAIPIGAEAPDTGAPETEKRKVEQPNEFYRVLDRWIGSIRAFLFDGNLFGRLGVAVLFIGLAFLIKEAIRVGFFPIELRLAAAFAAGAVMIFLGWRLTGSRRGYGLTLQGGGIAVLYLTIFAAFRLYDLIQAETAFIFLAVIIVLGTVIALLQNSQSLAVISLLGGFAAPVITSSGSGDHVALFSYYAVLNIGVFFIAWNRPWRAVNLTGFFSTFAIGTFWGGLSYEPDLFRSTEPFLILFFLMYFGISLMYALRHGLNPKKIVDGTLVFGLPVVAFTLQAALVEPFEYALAWSALAMGGCYAVTAWYINRRKPELMRTMIEALAGVSLALLSMTIPFALDATWTGTGWALEGAALIWLGIKQQRLLVRLGGFALTVMASVSFLYGLEDTSYTVRETYSILLNPAYMGFLALSVSAFFAARQIDKNGAQLYRAERIVGIVLLAAGVLWWLAGGFNEFAREFSEPDSQHMQIAFSALSLSALALIGKRISWTNLVRSTLALIPILYLFLFVNLLTLEHPFVSRGWIAWLIALFCIYAVLDTVEGSAKEGLLGFAHAAGLWLFTLLLTIESSWFLNREFEYQTVWPDISFLLVPVLIIGLATWMASSKVWPASMHPEAYLKIALVPVWIGLWCVTLYLSFENAGDPAPLPYIPLINPIDLMLGFTAFAGLYWYRTTTRSMPDFVKPAALKYLTWGLLATAFIWMNATIGRAVHHWVGIPFNGDSLLESSAFQMAISICWTLLALSAMTYSTRRSRRTPWFVSAGLLGVVVLKLFVVDLSNLATIHRVISFIGVGILLLVIGYLTPVPPKKEEQFSEATEQ